MTFFLALRPAEILSVDLGVVYLVMLVNRLDGHGHAHQLPRAFIR